MGKSKRNSNQVAAQIAAAESEEQQVVLGAESAEITEAQTEEKKGETPATEVPAAQVMYTAEQVAQMMKEAAAAAVAEALKAMPQQPQVVQVMADTEKVVMRWMAPVSDENVATFGENGRYGQVGRFLS